MSENPRLTPPADGQSTAAEQPARELTWRRAHPLSPLVRSWLILFVFAFTIGRNILEDIFAGEDTITWQDIQNVPPPSEDSWLSWASIFGAFWLPVLTVLMLAVLLVPFWVSWFFYLFAVDDRNVYVRSGMLFKKERKARLDRVQSIDINRRLGARVLGLAEVTFDVADGSDSALKVEFLSYRDARDLRSQLLAQVRQLRADRTDAPGSAARQPVPATSDLPGAPEPDTPAHPHRGRLAQHMTENFVGLQDEDERELLRVPVGRLLGSMVLSLGWALGLLFVLVIAGAMVWAGAPIAAAITSNLALIIAFVSSMWSRFNKGFNFRLSTGADGLKTRYGFTNTTTQTLPEGRMQMVAVHQPLLWRIPGWYRVTVSLAGKEASEASLGGELLPVGTFDDVMRILPLVVPGSALGGVGESELREGLAGSAEGRGYTVSPASARLLDPFTYRRNGFAVSPRLLLVRAGLLNRKLYILPHRKVQELALTQGPIQKRRGLASLDMKTAGSLSSCRVHNADARVARALLVRQAQLSVATSTQG